MSNHGGVPLSGLLGEREAVMKMAHANSEQAEQNARQARRNQRASRWLVSIALFNLGWGAWTVWETVYWVLKHPAPTRTTITEKDGTRTVTLDCPAGFRVAAVFTDYPRDAPGMPLAAELEEATALAICRKEGSFELRELHRPMKGPQVTIHTLSPEQEREMQKVEGKP